MNIKTRVELDYFYIISPSPADLRLLRKILKYNRF